MPSMTITTGFIDLFSTWLHIENLHIVNERNLSICPITLRNGYIRMLGLGITTQSLSRPFLTDTLLSQTADQKLWISAWVSDPWELAKLLGKIVGKAIRSVTRLAAKEVTGALQLCLGQTVGSETAVNAMKYVYSDSKSHAVLLVDTPNAFSQLNWQAALSYKYTPPMHQL